MTTTSTTFKIRHQAKDGHTEFRRLTQDNTSSLDDLRARAQSLFNLPADLVWFFTFLDDDNDPINVTEGYELEDAIAHARGATVKLAIRKEPVSEEGGSDHPPPHNQVPTFASLVDLALSALADASVATTAHHPCAPRQQQREYGALCDATDVALFPGKWYHQPASSVDLSPQAYEELSEEEQATFVKIDQPADLGNDQERYRQVRPTSSAGHGFCRRGPCKGKKNKGKQLPSHVGWCDATGEALYVGKGWHHKPGTTKDLGQTGFETLPEKDKAAWVSVQRPTDLGDNIDSYAVRRFHGGPCFQSFNEAQPQPEPKRAKTGLAEDGTLDAAHAQQGQEVAPTNDFEVLAGPSIAANAQVHPGVRVVPVWELRNVGPEGTLWDGVRLCAVDPNPLQVPTEGYEVPMLAAGVDSGLVSADLSVPADMPFGPVTAQFNLVDSSGNVFGPPLELIFNVTAKSLENEDELVQSLVNMGFNDDEECRNELRQNYGDVNNTALRLLRARKP